MHIARRITAAAAVGVMALAGSSVAAQAAPTGAAGAFTPAAADTRVSPDGKVNKMGAPLTAANNAAVARAVASGVPKGDPPKPGSKGVQKRNAVINGKALALTYFYAGGYQYPTGSPLPDGGYSRFRIALPYRNSADFHVVTEVAVESADSQQTVEIVAVTSDNICGVGNSPCLYPYHWIHNVGQGWGVNFTPVVGSPITVGETLPVGSDLRRFEIAFFDGVWWLGYEKTLGTYTWFGYFHGNLWTGASPSVTFNKMGLGQVFGEVAANSSTPCTDMGNGQFGDNGATPPVTNTSAGYTNSWTLRNPATGVTPSLSVNEPTPTLYRMGFQTSSVRSFHYGGPGSGGVVGGC